MSPDTDGPPTTRELARRLDVDGKQLQALAEQHPDPTAEVLLEWANAGTEHRDAVARWLDALKEERARRREEFTNVKWGGI